MYRGLPSNQPSQPLRQALRKRSEPDCILCLEEYTNQCGDNHPSTGDYIPPKKVGAPWRGQFLGGLGSHPPHSIRSLNTEALSYVADQLHHIQKECVLLVLLDEHGCYLKDHLIAVGDVCSARGSYQEVFREFFKAQACSFVIIHNHPSGSAMPSDSDVKMTEKVAELSGALNIDFTDHLIVTERKIYSFKKAGRI